MHGMHKHNLQRARRLASAADLDQNSRSLCHSACITRCKPANTLLAPAYPPCRAVWSRSREIRPMLITQSHRYIVRYLSLLCPASCKRICSSNYEYSSARTLLLCHLSHISVQAKLHVHEVACIVAFISRLLSSSLLATCCVFINSLL